MEVLQQALKTIWVVFKEFFNGLAALLRIAIPTTWNKVPKLVPVAMKFTSLN